MQLAELQCSVSRMSKESAKGPSTPAEYDKASHLELANAGTESCLFEGLNEREQQASDLLRMLNKELTELINLISTKDYQAMECRRKLLYSFFERIVSIRSILITTYVNTFHFVELGTSRNATPLGQSSQSIAILELQYGSARYAGSIQYTDRSRR